MSRWPHFRCGFAYLADIVKWRITEVASFQGGGGARLEGVNLCSSRSILGVVSSGSDGPEERGSGHLAQRG